MKESFFKITLRYDISLHEGLIFIMCFAMQLLCNVRWSLFEVYLTVFDLFEYLLGNELLVYICFVDIGKKVVRAYDFSFHQMWRDLFFLVVWRFVILKLRTELCVILFIMILFLRVRRNRWVFNLAVFVIILPQNFNNQKTFFDFFDFGKVEWYLLLILLLLLLFYLVKEV